MRRYTITYDNPKRGDYQLVARLLKRIGHVERFRHPRTSMHVELRSDADFASLKSALLRALDPHKGSAIIFSQRSGFVFRCDNRSNSKGCFIRD